MNVLFLKSVLLPLVSNKDVFDIQIQEPTEITQETLVFIKVAAIDMKKIIGHRGKMYRAIKIVIKCALKKDNVNVTVDIWDKR